MKRQIIIRLMIEDKASLAAVRAYILPSLIYQSNHEFKCFIEYPESLMEDIKELEEKVLRGDQAICFVPSKGRHYYDGQWEERLLLTEIERYIQELELEESDELVFMEWPTDRFYTFNIVKELLEYQVENKEKVLYIPTGYSMKHHKIIQMLDVEPPKELVYLCTVKEYKKYFKVYDLIMGFTYKQFERFPKGVLREVTYILCDE